MEQVFLFWRTRDIYQESSDCMDRSRGGGALLSLGRKKGYMSGAGGTK